MTWTLPDQDAPSRLKSESEIRSLLARERYYRDTRQWQRLRESYHPDPSKTMIDISWHKGDADSFVSLSEQLGQRSQSPTFHTISVVEIYFNIALTKALTESNGAIKARLRDPDSGAWYEMTSECRFVSRVERVNGNGPWKMLTFECVYTRDGMILTDPICAKIVNSGYAEKIAQKCKERGYRESYKYLSWMVESKGNIVNKDLPGIDQPETATKFMEDGFAWLNE